MAATLISQNALNQEHTKRTQVTFEGYEITYIQTTEGTNQVFFNPPVLNQEHALHLMQAVRAPLPSERNMVIFHTHYPLTSIEKGETKQLIGSWLSYKSSRVN